MLVVSLGIVGLAVLLNTAFGTGAAAQEGSSAYPPDLVARGADVFGSQCAICHGANGRGSEDGPSLVGVGAAAADFQLRTGRMPLESPDAKPRHQVQKVTDEERAALVAYVDSLGDGPAIPDVSGYQQASLAEGLELFTNNCAACHGPTAQGVAVGQRDVSSTLDIAQPVEIAEAVRSGPGVMPVFAEDTLSDEELEAVVNWVVHLRERATPGGATFGRSGPVTEGFVAWVVGFGLLALVMYLLGEKTSDRPKEEPRGDA